MKIELSENIKFLRKINDLSQEELAAHLKMSRKMIANYESGDYYPTLPKLIEMCQLFKVDLSQLTMQNLRISRLSRSASQPLTGFQKLRIEAYFKQNKLKEPQKIIDFVENVS